MVKQVPQRKYEEFLQQKRVIFSEVFSLKSSNSESVWQKYNKERKISDNPHYHIICIQTLPCKTWRDGLLRDAFQKIETTNRIAIFSKQPKNLNNESSRDLQPSKTVIQFTQQTKCNHSHTRTIIEKLSRGKNSVLRGEKQPASFLMRTLRIIGSILTHLIKTSDI